MPTDSPVRSLIGQILSTFENANPATASMLRQAVAAGSINPELELDCVAGAPRTPYISGNPPTITLHITHLEMLWAFIYGMFVLYEHEMREAMLHQRLPVSDPAYSEAVRLRAGNLLVWSKSLRNDYTQWPTDAPSPMVYLPEEKQLSEKVNNLFLSTAALMLHHEYCHATQRHMAPNRTSEEILEQEKEADDFAHHQFLDAASTELDKRKLGWSVLILPLSCLYLVSGPLGLFQSRHPHIHHRIGAALSRLNFMEDGNQDYFNGLCIAAVTTYMVEHGLLDRDFRNDPDLKKQFERASDALTYFYDHLDMLRVA